jgi:glycosyltransferase involved in cell wall biosynthesis
VDTDAPPLISVIVPVYNARRTLRPCLESLARQTDPHFEVVLVDDRSTDDSREIARPFSDDARFRIVALPHNKGQAVSRNKGVSVAEGRLIAFIDADCEAPETWLATHRRLLAECPDVDVISGGYLLNDQDPPAARFASREASFRRLSLPSLELRSLTTANCVLRREAFEEAGGFPEYYVDARRDPAQQKAAATNEDSELGYLIAARGRRIRWTHDNPVRHHFRETWRAYLRAQRVSSWAGALSVFRFPGMLTTDDLYSGEPIVPQLVVTGLALLSPLLLALGWPGLGAWVAIQAAGLAFFALLHRRFFRYLGPEGMGDYGRARVFGWMLVARILWVQGVLQGIRDGLRMRWSHRRAGRPLSGGLGP